MLSNILVSARNARFCLCGSLERGETRVAGIPLSVELRSKALRDAWPDPVDRAKALRVATEAWMARLS